jgi:hypothetical protein
LFLRFVVFGITLAIVCQLFFSEPEIFRVPLALPLVLLQPLLLFLVNHDASLKM